MWIRDLVDLIYLEHAIIRVRLSEVRDLMSECEKTAFRKLAEIHDFVVNWHAKIEDKYLFPLLPERTRPLSNDHLLIEKFGNSVIRERRKDWVSRYVDVVIDHNRNEEVLVLEDLRPLASGLLEKVLREAEGFPNYSRITGLILDRVFPS
jgi:hemerythrin superfamily protein